MDSVIDEIKQKIDIVQLIQEYIPLKKAGMNYKALCPFHSEKTPSFFVSPERQIWHCFGCGKGGDIFAFIKEIEGVEFADALRLLAKKAGVTLKKQDKTLQTKRTRLINILDLTSRYYHKALRESKAARLAREYLKERKIDDLTIDEFRLGFAPDLWHVISDFLIKKGYKLEEILEAGLTIKKEDGGFYDRFRNRLIFPIWDVHGSVVGFGGRTLSKDKSIAKYINTPQTLVYNKSNILYGLDKAKTEIRRKNQAIVVEGYTDVISSHWSGVTNVISSSGTALTEGQIQLIKRYTLNVILAFDMDLAGDEATKRGIDLAILLGMNVKVALLPQGKDPDECIKKDPKLWVQAIKTAKPILEYYFDIAFRNKNTDSVEDRKSISTVLLPVIKKIPDKIEQAFYIQKLARKLRVSEDILTDALKSLSVQKPSYFKEKITQKQETSEIDKVGERLLALALIFPKSLVFDQIKEDYFSPNLAPLYKNLKNYYNRNKQFKLSQLIKDLAQNNQNLADEVNVLILSVEKDFSDTSDPEIQKKVSLEIESCLKRIKISNLKQQLKEIEKDLFKAEAEGNLVKIELKTHKFTELSQKLAQLT